MFMCQKLLKKIDANRALAEANDIFDKCLPKNDQICLTHKASTNCEWHKLYEGAGSLYNFDRTRLEHNEDEFVIFNQMFENTYLHEIYLQFSNIGRFRILKMKGPKCYTIHQDLTKRFHIPLKTNKNCMFVFPENNSILRLDTVGDVYLVDTREPHTFINGSREDRIHLVFDDISDYQKRDL